MPAAKRRKVSTPVASSSKGSLNAFTRVSKHAVTPKELKDVTSSQVVEESAGGKRRLFEDEVSTPTLASQEIVKSRPIRPLPLTRRSQQVFETPKKLASPPTPASDTPTTKAANLFNRVSLSKSSPAQWDSSPLRQDTSIFEDSEILRSSQVSVDQGLPDADEQLPAELTDLMTLHASFLNALSLHYAHNGTHTPADIRQLLPSIALNWGKRSVTLVDVQRALGVQNIHTSSDFSSSHSDLTLSNYGNGKICIEKEAVFGRKGVMARPLNEQLLTIQYTTNLLALWKKHSQTAAAIVELEQKSISIFIASLPLQAIPTNTSLDKISPTLTKGARRLADLKASHALKKSQQTTPKKQTLLVPSSDSPDSSPAKASPLSRKSSLLDRIRAKSAASALLPPPPSKSDRLRISALHRLPEVIQILTVMSTAGNAGQSRVSFSMGTVLGKLKDSCRGEIGVEEGRMCLEVLGGDVGCGWVRVVGGISGKGGVVVIDRERRPEEGVVEEKIKLALASANGGGMDVDEVL